MNASINSLPSMWRTASLGFTLIELMVTIAVMGIIASIAAPSISVQLADQRVKSAAATLENVLKEAKAESVIRRQNVSVIYDSTATPKSITLQAAGTDLASYSISDQSTISITPTTATTVVFQPSKFITGDDDIFYTVCDSGSSDETPRQVHVNKTANINMINAGSC